MYLKSIEVLGFKSFANRIVFDFHHGITGIVGPNGSGKSNVADAVRWVLGEQRIKQLRGGTMQDVIFAGTERRRPQSYASVAITLDNRDKKLPVSFDEVTVTRKLYRSGESEYLLNGSPCRLKDINELFYDTGIGKEGYSIIGQGQIDKILSGKPEERRELFDEAAGIVKFKKRKNQSIKKLEEEESNLTRVTDILTELQRQVEPLERQSKTAREYLVKKEELKRFDINTFLFETESQKQQMGSLTAALDDARAQYEEASCAYEEMKEAYEEIEREMTELEMQSDETKRQQSETRLLRQQLESRIDILREQINTVRSNDAHYGQRMRELEEQVQTLLDERKKCASQMEELKERFREEEEKKEALEKACEKAAQDKESVEALLEQSRDNLVRIERERAVDGARLSGFARDLENFTRQQLSVENRLHTVSEELSQLQKEGDQRRLEYEKTCREMADCDHRLESISSRIRDQKEKADELSQHRQTLWQSYHRDRSRLETVKNMAMRYEGYGNSIKKVMEQKQREPGLHGVVADLIRTKKEYETAIETALGGSIQNIVTSDEQTAKRMIEYLKRNKLGRATFLPLSAMRPSGKKPEQDILRFPGVIGVACDLVETKKEFVPLKEQLLGRTFVVRHIDDGIALSKKYRQTLRIVTLEGELLNPGGAMTGGSYKNTSNLLGRQRELEGLARSLEEQKKELSVLERDIAACKETRSRLFEELDAQKAERAGLDVKKQRLEMARGDEAKRLDRLAREKEEMEQECRSLKDKALAIRQERETLTQKADHVDTNEKELRAKTLFLEQSLQSGEEILRGLERQRQQGEITDASLRQKQEHIQANEDRVENELARLAQQKLELDRNRVETVGEIEKKEAEIEDLRAAIANAVSLLEEIGEELQSLSARRAESGRRHKGFLEKREELTKHMASLDKEIYRLQDQTTRLEEQMQRLSDYMWAEYELTYNHAKNLKDDDLNDLSAMKSRIRELKNEIRALGPVNVNAIEEFREVNERYVFLQGQYDDLVEAKKTLEEIIASLDESMRTQFTAQFARIKEEFDYVFKQLFGGGKGTLELMEDADILEAGVRIIAQPPGKKLQNMMQLSGGEKALTAISLLFAIQNLKPSPFCLLDEIEAALDDNNVNRYAKYLHKLTKDTQFIVITHRRGTMTAADRLYGITMQEKGVSTLVSVDLIEDELEKQEKKEKGS